MTTMLADAGRKTLSLGRLPLRAIAAVFRRRTRRVAVEPSASCCMNVRTAADERTKAMSAVVPTWPCCC